METLTNNPANLINDLASIITDNRLTVTANNAISIDFSLLVDAFCDDTPEQNDKIKVSQERFNEISKYLLPAEMVKFEIERQKVQSSDAIKLFNYIKANKLDIVITCNNSYSSDFIALFKTQLKKEITASVTNNELNIIDTLHKLKALGYKTIGLQSYCKLDNCQSYGIRTLLIDNLLTDTNLKHFTDAVTKLVLVYQICKKDGTTHNIKESNVLNYLSVYKDNSLKGSRKLSNAIMDIYDNI